MEEVLQQKYGNELENKKEIILDGDSAHFNVIEGLENLIQLEGLRLSLCGISVIRGLNTLTNLRILTLAENGITEITGLNNLINLERLDLSDNQITEIKGLNNLVKLKKLNLSDNQITEMGGFDNLVKLEILDLSYNINLTKIKGLDNLINLRKLNISVCQIQELNGLSKLKNLAVILNDDVGIKNINYLSIPDSICYITNGGFKIDYSDRFLRIKKLCLKVRREIVKIIFTKKCKKLLDEIHKYKPDSDYINSIVKPRFEEMKKE